MDYSYTERCCKTFKFSKEIIILKNLGSYKISLMSPGRVGYSLEV